MAQSHAAERPSSPTGDGLICAQCLLGIVSDPWCPSNCAKTLSTQRWAGSKTGQTNSDAVQMITGWYLELHPSPSQIDESCLCFKNLRICTVPLQGLSNSATLVGSVSRSRTTWYEGDKMTAKCNTSWKPDPERHLRLFSRLAHPIYTWRETQTQSDTPQPPECSQKLLLQDQGRPVGLLSLRSTRLLQSWHRQEDRRHQAQLWVTVWSSAITKLSLSLQEPQCWFCPVIFISTASCNPATQLLNFSDASS